MRRLILIFALSTLALSPTVHAQSNQRELAEANRAAMDAYNNLEIEVAKETLQQAISAAEQKGLTGAGLARTYANLGVVEVGGFSDASAALDAFISALREDPTVEPDPLVSTPEVLQVFAQAKRKAGQGGARPRQATPPPAPAVVEGNLEHLPAPEQLANTAVPVFVASSDPEIASMKIFFRSTGMKKPKADQMTRTSEGFTYLIPCGDVVAPTVEYFVIAYDSADQKVGNAGSPQNPVAIPVVRTRSQPAPSLPGETPPSKCGGDEEEDDYAAATPSSSGAVSASYGREGSLGDTCNDDNDCGEGLACYDNFCALGTKGADKDKDSGDAPRVYIDVGFGVGLALVTSGMAADSALPGTVAQQASTQSGGNLMAARDYARGYGWDCQVTNDAMGRPVFSNCEVVVGSSGFVVNPALTLALGYRATDRFGVAVTGRYQLGYGQGGMGGLSLGLRGDLLLTEPAADGFHFGLLGGVLVGPLQARPKRSGMGEGPYATSGWFGVQAGLRTGYRFTRNIGLVVTPAANLMFGGFMFDFDVTGGIELAF